MVRIVHRIPGTAVHFLVAFLLLSVSPVGPAHPQEMNGPMEALRTNIEGAVEILEDRRYADGQNRIEQRDRLCRLAKDGFDFPTFVRLSLAHDLEKFTFDEVTEFTELFVQFLCRFYIPQLQERYNRERVLFQKQALLSPTRARVQIAILWRNVEIPVTVFMTRTNGTWKAYDVNVFGIGAVHNYRQQIHEILEDMDPGELIAFVKKRLSEGFP